MARTSHLQNSKAVLAWVTSRQVTRSRAKFPETGSPKVKVSLVGEICQYRFWAIGVHFVLDQSPTEQTPLGF